MKRKLKFVVLAFLLLCPFIALFAQTDTTFKANVVFIGSGEPVARTQRTYQGQAVKFGVLDFFAGMYGLHYQRELSDIFSLQAGLGATGKNFIQSFNVDGEGLSFATYESPFWVGEGKVDEEDNFWNYEESRTAKPGFFVNFVPQLFYEEDGFDGHYFALKVEYRRYNHEASDVQNTDNLQFNESDKFNETEKQTIFALMWGGQTLNEKTCLDWNIAVGIRNRNMEKRDIGYYSDGTGPVVYDAVLSDFKSTSLYFEIGFKIGVYKEGKRKEM